MLSEYNVFHVPLINPDLIEVDVIITITRKITLKKGFSYYGYLNKIEWQSMHRITS